MTGKKARDRWAEMERRRRRQAREEAKRAKREKKAAGRVSAADGKAETLTERRVLPIDSFYADVNEPVGARERRLADIPQDAREFSWGKRGRQLREVGRRTERRMGGEA